MIRILGTIGIALAIGIVFSTHFTGSSVSPRGTIAPDVDLGEPLRPFTSVGDMLDEAAVVRDAAFDGRRLAVLDGGLHTVSVFDTAGHELWTAGAAGDGPGEFDRPVAVALLDGGGALVADGGRPRITRFSESGDVVESWVASGRDSDARHVEDLVVDGRSVFVLSNLMTAEGEEASRYFVIDRYDLDGTFREEVVRELHYRALRDYSGAFRAASFDAGGGDVLFAVSDTFLIRRPTGTKDPVRRASPRRWPVEDEVRAEIRHAIEEMPGQLTRGLEVPDFWPIVERVGRGASGGTAVSTWRSESSRDVEIFTPDGELRGRASAGPFHGGVFFSNGFLLVIEPGEVGGEEVRIWALDAGVDRG